MPNTQIGFTAGFSWTQSRANSPFASAVAGPDGETFSLSGLNISTFNELAPAQYVITASGSQNVDLTSLVNGVQESFALGHALTILILPTGGSITLSPGTSNGLTWFFGGTSPTITIPAGGMLAYSEPVAGPGTVVDATHKILSLTNNGGTTTTVIFVVLGSTT